MFQDLDTTLARLLDDPAAPAPLRAAAVMFLPPDRNFQSRIVGQTAINLFLHRIRENLELRDNEPFPEPGDPPTIRRLPLLRVDCSYLVTAWSKVVGEPQVLVEHQLLGLALRWLSRFQTIPAVSPVNPSFAYLSGSLNRPDFPLPLTMSARLDPDRVPVDFWTALGIAPRPSFDLTVAIAIDLDVAIDEGTPVITKEIDYFRLDPPAPKVALGKLFSIGGTVRSSATGDPVTGATVELVELERQQTTRADGQFLFDGITEGSYHLRASAPGMAARRKQIEVPNSVAEEYDFEL